MFQLLTKQVAGVRYRFLIKLLITVFLMVSPAHASDEDKKIQLNLDVPTYRPSEIIQEGFFIRMEHYESSGDYLLVYKLCDRCKRIEKRFESDAIIDVNLKPVSIEYLYENRMRLNRSIATGYLESSNKLTWFYGNLEY